MVVEQSWVRKGLVIAAVGAGLIPTAILGLWGFMIATKTPLHPKAEDVPAVSRVAPASKWAAAAEQAHQIARAGLVEQNLPGLSVAVGVDGEVVWAEGLGWANLESRMPVALDTPFRIGTASIALTSAAVGVLLEDGRLTLDQEIQTDVPAFPKKQWPVTLRQLMGHLAGIRRDDGDEENLSDRCGRAVEGVARFADAPLRSEPGTVYLFSSYGWILVSAAVESASHEPFFTFMRTRVFDPLGMADTRSDSGRAPLPEKAVFYFPRFAGDPVYGPQEPREVSCSCLSGAGAFLSTPSDIVRFVMAINGGRLLQPATVERLQATQRTASGVETGYGLGWDRETVTLAGAPTTMVGHDGTLMGGPVSSFMAFPDRGLVVSVMSNTAYADTEALALKIAEMFVEPVRTPAGR